MGAEMLAAEAWPHDWGIVETTLALTETPKGYL